MMHFVRTFSVTRAYGGRLIAVEEVRHYGKIVYIKNIFKNGWWEDAHPSSYSLGSAPGNKLRKPSKESGIFQSLGTINFVLFAKRLSQKGRVMAQWPFLHTLLFLWFDLNQQYNEQVSTNRKQ